VLIACVWDVKKVALSLALLLPRRFYPSSELVHFLSADLTEKNQLSFVISRDIQSSSCNLIATFSLLR